MKAYPIKPIPVLTAAQKARFWAKVARSSPQECWPWTGSTSGKGYGTFQLARKVFPAHRIAYWLCHGAMSDGLLVCHTCDFRKCCNPAHLFLGSAADNIRDAQSKLRLAHGTDHHAAKLEPAQILAIRRQAAEGTAVIQLARLYHVTRRSIRDILRRVTWAHV